MAISFVCFSMLLVTLIAVNTYTIHEQYRLQFGEEAARIMHQLKRASRVRQIDAEVQTFASAVRKVVELTNADNVLLYDKRGNLLAGAESMQLDFAALGDTLRAASHAHMVEDTRQSLIYANAVVLEEYVQLENAPAVAHDIRSDGKQRLGFIVIEMDKSALRAHLQRAWTIELYLMLAITLLVAMIFAYSISAIVRPIKQLNVESRNGDLVKELTNRTSILQSENRNITLENEQNRLLIKSMNRKIEQERYYVVRELHDQLNASLIAIKYQLNAITNCSEVTQVSPSMPSQSINKGVATINQLLDEVYRATRRITQRLRPEVIDSLGLIGAIRDLLVTFKNKDPEQNYQFEYRGDFSALTPALQITIYRIIQESLSNIAKYAKATEVIISLCNESTHCPNELKLSIEDNGQGFNPSTLTYQSGVGLISMRERTHEYGGDFDIQSSPAQGTKIFATFPCRHSSPTASIQDAG